MAAGDEYFEDLLKIILFYTGERNTALNVFYASCLGAHGATAEDLDTLAENIGTSFASNVLPHISENYGFSMCSVADWTSADGLTGFQDFDDQGSVSGTAPTDQVAILLNEEGLMRYRGGHGRFYLPTTGTTNMESGLSWTGAFVSAVTAAAADFLNYVATQTIGDDLLTPVLYHRGSKDLEQGYEDIVGITCSPTPGTQRRRVRRVGHLA